jgi:hypothetical protein
MSYEFGNDPAKKERYLGFWKREPVKRPLVGFTTLGWFPIDEFKATAAWPSGVELTPEMVHPEEFLDDWENHLREGEAMADDLIRGVSPSQAIFWCCGTLGCKMRVLPGTVVSVEQSLPWEKLLGMKVDLGHPWFSKYLECIDALVKRAAGRYPVSHGTLCGPLDYAVALRGHEQTVMDMMDEPEKAARFLQEMGDVFIRYTQAAWSRIPRFMDGCYDAQYRLWSPGTIARMQEDAIAVMSPGLYREFIAPVDRRIAATFQNPFMHLHSTSMIVMEQLLEIREIKAFEINHDVGGPPVGKMVPYFQMVQKAGVPLIIRGDFTAEDLRELMDSLEPSGLFIYIMVKDRRQMEPLRPLVGL